MANMHYKNRCMLGFVAQELCGSRRQMMQFFSHELLENVGPEKWAAYTS